MGLKVTCFCDSIIPLSIVSLTVITFLKLLHLTAEIVFPVEGNILNLQGSYSVPVVVEMV